MGATPFLVALLGRQMNEKLSAISRRILIRSQIYGANLTNLAHISKKTPVKNHLTGVKKLLNDPLGVRTYLIMSLKISVINC
jgi:hypothetical protein